MIISYHYDHYTQAAGAIHRERERYVIRRHISSYVICSHSSGRFGEVQGPRETNHGISVIAHHFFGALVISFALPRPTWPRSGSGSPSLGRWHCLRWLATATARAQHNVPHLGRTFWLWWPPGANMNQHDLEHTMELWWTMAFFRHITIQCQNMSKSESVGHSTPVR